MMGYLFEHRLGLSQSHFTKLRLGAAIQKGQSFNKYQQEMITAKTSYKRLDMLADWNRAKAIEHSRRGDGYQRATTWYDKIAMPWMKKKEITPTEFFGWASRRDMAGFDTAEEYDEWQEYFEQVEDEFEERYEKKG